MLRLRRNPFRSAMGPVVIDRTNRSWQDLYSMARLFLQNRYQTTTSGGGEGTTMMFEMNALFEEFVGRSLVRALAVQALASHYRADAYSV